MGARLATILSAAVVALAGLSGTALTWEVVRTPVPAGAGLRQRSLRCVLQDRIELNGGRVHQQLGCVDELLGGVGRHLEAVPLPSDAESSELNDVSCWSSTGCMAVGVYKTSKGNRPLAERWNGRGWAPLQVPIPSDAADVNLTGVSCPAAASCMTVGGFISDFAAYETFGDLWDGTKWTVLKTVPPAVSLRDGDLSSVSCPSKSDCEAVGSYQVENPVKSMAERWNGSTWSLQRFVNPTTFSNINAVSCSAADACTAVGQHDGNHGPLVERWAGTDWTVEPTSDLGGAEYTALNKVDCQSPVVLPSATTCPTTADRDYHSPRFGTERSGRSCTRPDQRIRSWSGFSVFRARCLRPAWRLVLTRTRRWRSRSPEREELTPSVLVGPRLSVAATGRRIPENPLGRSVSSFAMASDSWEYLSGGLRKVARSSEP
jgi:hypothetical protein